MTAKGRFARYSQRKKPPANHKWVPVSEWKLARLNPLTPPTTRARSCRFAMREKASTFYLITVLPQEDAQPRWALRNKLKVKSTKSGEGKDDRHINKTHLASLQLIEGLQHRFLDLFLKLNAQDQQALIENFLVHNLSVWQFGPEELLSPEDAEQTPLAETNHAAFHTLMQRLARLAAQTQNKMPYNTNNVDDEFDDVFDNVFGDQDPLDTPQQQQIMRKFLEASISAILQLQSFNTPHNPAP